jgi:hypothetical protein
MEILSIVGLIALGALFLGAAYLCYGKDWRFGSYFSLVVSAGFLLTALPATRAFLRTTAWAAFVTALESTGQGLVRLNKTIDDVRTGMQHDRDELAKVQKDTGRMQGSLRDAQQRLENQQAKLADIDQLLKSFYEARKTEAFDTKTDSTDLIVLKHDDTHATIYILLSAPPIPQTVDIQWHVYAQPKNSYLVVNNVIIFRWGQSVESFRSQQLTVTYVAEPKEKPLYSKLSITDNRVRADEDPLMYGYLNLDPVILTLAKGSKDPNARITMEQFRAAAKAQRASTSPTKP